MASAYQTIPFACTRQVFGRRRKRHLFSIRLHLNGTESVRDIQCRRVWGLCDAETLYGRTAFFQFCQIAEWNTLLVRTRVRLVNRT
jgi:hypothetical protein